MNTLKKDDILVNTTTRNYLLVKCVKSHFHKHDNITVVSLENMSTGAHCIVCGDDLSNYKYLEHNMGDCNLCEHNLNGCPNATCEGYCPFEMGYSFKYSSNRDEKRLIDKIIKLLQDVSNDQNKSYTNVYLEVKKILEKNKRVNDILKNMLIAELKDEKADVSDVIKTFSEKLFC